MSHLVRVLLCTIPCLFLSSCMYYVSVTKNTFADTQSIPFGFLIDRSFHIEPLKDGQTNPLLFKEVSRKISVMIKKQLHEIADDASEADYWLIYKLNTSSRASTINVPKYIPGETQVKSGNVYGYGGSVSYREKTKASDQIIYVPETYIYFTTTIHIWVYDAQKYRENKTEDCVWQGSASHCSTNADVRVIIDYLLVSIFKSFGSNTGQNITSHLGVNDIQELYE